jgi:RNA polymerase sigma factor (sigma-70 family)
MTMTCEATLVPLSTADLILGEAPNLRCVARRLAKCTADADDLVQDTLLRAYAARRRFQPGTSIRAWTTTILRRLFLTNVASAKRRRVMLDVDAGEPLDVAPSRVPASARDTAPRYEEVMEELDDDVKRALAKLPAYYRGPFFQHVAQNRTCAEIARTFSIAPGTVMSRIHRARVRLRADLVAHRLAAQACA